MTNVTEVFNAEANLFGPPRIPAGFEYQPQIISPTEEAELARAIATLPLEAFRFQGFVAKRRVMSFGWRYDFDRARFEQTDPIPEFLLPLRARAAAFAGLGSDDLAHALVTEYAPGTPIGWHRDRPVFEDVIGVSLLSPCTFRFRRKSDRRTALDAPVAWTVKLNDCFKKKQTCSSFNTGATSNPASWS